jgi:hypothetical protein
MSIENSLKSLSTDAAIDLANLGQRLHHWCSDHPNAVSTAEVIGAAAVAVGSIAGGARVTGALKEVNATRRALASMETESVKIAESISIAPAEVMTAEPLRTLIRANGYGTSTEAPKAMEEIIAQARSGVLNGQITTDLMLEKYIAKSYIPKFHPAFKWSDSWEPDGRSGYPLRMQPFSGKIDSAEFNPLSRHAHYLDRVGDIVPERKKFTHVATETIDGNSVNFTKTKFRTWGLEEDWAWLVPSSSKTIKLANERSEKLFQEILQERGTQSPEILDRNLNRVAEMHWLNSQTWKFNRGSAGIADLKARTMLEVSGIDSGRYKIGVDPNLHALTSRNLASFTAEYKHLFEVPPAYF